MKKYLFAGFCTFLLLSLQAFAIEPNYKIIGQSILVKTDSTDLKIEVYSPEIIRIVKSPLGRTFSKVSLSVIKTPEKAPFEVTEKSGLIKIKTSKLQVYIYQTSGKIAFYDLSNNLLLTESTIPSMFLPVMDIDKKTYTVKQLFQLSSSEGIYGLGQDQKGVMNYRNHNVLLQQSNMHVTNPFLLSTRGYGLLWDNYSATEFADSKEGALFQSVIGDCIDYYFIYGVTPDGVIAGYRNLTGPSPMFGKWAFGFWQCRERYTSQDEIVGIVEKFRQLKIPLDNIVQDWRYWGLDNENWNSTEFGNPLYPDPKEMIEKIHKNNAHVMISVWPSFGKKTAIYKELKENGSLLDFVTWPPDGGVRVYDPFNPKARNIYWKYMNKNLFSIGMDAWWLDATEPEQGDSQGKIDSTLTALGSFKHFRNAFPLQTNKGVYENQRLTSPEKRVFILTRSAFAGQQRYASSVWSGDIEGNWEVFRHQISGGLNFSMSGIPYWTTDIGGFTLSRDLYPLGVADPSYQELYVRWFQFATFCPLFRSHGTSTPREIFNFGSKGYWAYDVQEKYINLRYRLMPYIYSLGWKVTHGGYTIMRGLPMDFAKDTAVFNIDNQYLFGPSLLVCPVTEAMYTLKGEDKKLKGEVDFSTVRSKQVYLPQSEGWFDFWSGKKMKGGNTVAVLAPIDMMPLYVRAGSIIPFGPFIQYATEKIADPVELRVYTGADGAFELYEDENDNYNYEKGDYAIIPLKWNNQTHTLTIGKRKGFFPGMIKNRTFNIVFVNENHGVGIEIENQPDKIIKYYGDQIVIKK